MAMLTKLFQSPRFRRPIVLLAGVFAMALLLAAVVEAAATFGPLTGPTWLNPGYRWAVRVLTISNPDKIVCLDYTVTPPGTNTVLNCACDDSVFGDCTVGTGDWTCTIPTNIPSATVTWRVGTWSAGSGGTCGSEKTLAQNGSFGTGPLAVAVNGLQATTGQGAGGVAAAVAMGAAALVVFGRRRRS